MYHSFQNKCISCNILSYFNYCPGYQYDVGLKNRILKYSFMCSMFSTNNRIEVVYHTSAHPCISLLPRSSLFMSPNANKTKTSRKHYDPQKNTQKEKLE